MPGRTRSLLLLVVAIGTALGAALWWWPANEESGWQVVHDLDLRRNEPIETWFADAASGQARPLPAGQGIHLGGTRIAWLAGIAETGDVRCTIDVLWPERVDGCEIHLGISEGDAPSSLGLNCQFGAGAGSRHFATIARSPAAQQTFHACRTGLEAGRRHRLSLTRRQNGFTLAIDGTTVLAREGEMMPYGDAFRRIGIRAWTPVVISRITIERTRHAMQLSPLAIGDAFLAAGDAARARAAWLRVAEDHAGTTVAGEALARTCTSLADDPAEPAWERAAILRRLEAAHPASPQLRRSRIADLQRRWRDGDGDAVLALVADPAAATWAPAAALALLGERQPRPDPAQAATLLRLAVRDPELDLLDISDLGLASLEPLRGAPVRALLAAGNQISDLAPLASLRLIELVLARNAVRDLGPLRGMPLRILDVSDNPVSDLDPVADAPLRILHLRRTEVGSLAACRGEHLEVLACGRSRVASLPARLPALIRLDVEDTPLSDLSSLRASSALDSLNANRTTVADLAPLRQARRLRTLALRRTPVAALDAVSGAPLDTLDISESQVASLAPLAGMPLRQLSCADTPITDLSPLDGCPLAELDISRLAATALPSRLPHLHQLVAIDTPLASFAPLATAPLRRLLLGQAPPALPEPLLAPSLEVLLVAPAPNQCEAYEQIVHHLRQTGRPWAAEALAASLAITRGERASLLAMAQRQGDTLRVFTGRRLNHDQAQALARSLGARLPLPIDAADEQALLGLLGPLDGCWLGLDESQPWPTHQPRPPASPLPIQGWRLFRSGGASRWVSVTRPPERDGVSQVVLEWTGVN